MINITVLNKKIIDFAHSVQDIIYFLGPKKKGVLILDEELILGEIRYLLHWLSAHRFT